MKKELGIYIHIPFCKQKCYYCDFISFPKKEEEISRYIDALKEEIIINKEKAKDYKITTIYIGGGTPSYIDSKNIINLLETLKDNYPIEKDAEITIEINPGTVNKEKLENYKKAGINRISIGLQSVHNNLLKLIGRIHTYEQFLENYNLARNIGFCNINVDLILALPEQTNEMFIESLQKVIDLNPEHISTYSLILEKGTVLEKQINEGQYKLPDEEIERKMYWETKKTLEQNGYIHYEVSNFSKAQKQSKHNLNCWYQKEYLGFGIAAHSYYNKIRYSNTQNLNKYIKSIGSNSTSNQSIQIIHEIQTIEDEQKEYMLLGLRKIEGVSISAFKAKFIQNPVYIFRKELDKLVKEGLIELDMDNIKLTNKGLDLANQVWEEFV